MAVGIRHRLICAFGVAVASMAGLTLSGCGEEENKTIIPEVSPADKAKESMDYYRNQMKKGGAKSARGAAGK